VRVGRRDRPRTTRELKFPPATHVLLELGSFSTDGEYRGGSCQAKRQSCRKWRRVHVSTGTSPTSSRCSARSNS
jgi:hypothetical protein